PRADAAVASPGRVPHPRLAPLLPRPRALPALRDGRGEAARADPLLRPGLPARLPARGALLLPGRRARPAHRSGRLLPPRLVPRRLRLLLDLEEQAAALPLPGDPGGGGARRRRGGARANAPALDRPGRPRDGLRGGAAAAPTAPRVREGAAPRRDRGAVPRGSGRDLVGRPPLRGAVLSARRLGGRRGVGGVPLRRRRGMAPGAAGPPHGGPRRGRTRGVRGARGAGRGVPLLPERRLVGAAIPDPRRGLQRRARAGLRAVGGDARRPLLGRAAILRHVAQRQAPRRARAPAGPRPAHDDAAAGEGGEVFGEVRGGRELVRIGRYGM